MNEKNYVPLLYVGRCGNPDCPSPYHIESLHAVIDPSELPERCKCGAKIRWEVAVNRHNVQSLKKKAPSRKTAILALAITILTLAGAAAAFRYTLRHKTYTAKEVAAAQAQVASMSVADVLNQLNENGISDATIGQLLNASPHTIRRLRTKESQPTPAIQAQILGLAAQWYLNGCSWFLTSLQVRGKDGICDPWYAFPDPEREIVN